MEDGEAFWQPHASETPQLPSIEEADADDEESPAGGAGAAATAGRAAAASAGGDATADDANGGRSADPVQRPNVLGEVPGSLLSDAADGRRSPASAAAAAAAAAAAESDDNGGRDGGKGGGGEGEGREEEAEVEEERVVGAVQWPVYRSYLKAVGWPMLVAVLLSLALMQVRALQVVIAKS